MTDHTTTFVTGLVLTLVSLGGCAVGGTGPIPEPEIAPAHASALSTYEASLGTLIEVYGTGFPTTSRMGLQLALDGEWIPTDGPNEAVHLVVPLRVVDQGTARWTSFGPFAVPFGSHGAQTGVFRGTIKALIENAEGVLVAEDEDPTPVEISVLPSIRVRELQPITASCAGPVRRGLGGAAYRMQVEAIGFTPRSFTYTLTAPGLDAAPISLRTVATGPIDTVGNGGELVLPVVPLDRKSYGLAVSVQSVDTDGRNHQAVFAMSVHRPIEVYYNGNVTVAELLEPVPVSGCIPGGEIGRSVTYSETNTETRDRRLEYNWNQNWMDQHTVMEGSSDTVGLNIRNGVGFSTTDGRSINWSFGTMFGVNGSIGNPMAASIGFSSSLSSSEGGDVSHSETGSQDYSEGMDASTTTTESVADTEGTGGFVGGSLAMTVSSSDTISRSFTANVIATRYGVFYRQTTRMLRRAALVTYNLCGAAESIGDVELEDWTWSPDLAQGFSCPPFPTSNLPPAECFVAPCAGE